MATGIHDAGQVAGVVQNTIANPTSYDAFIYHNGAWTDLGPGEGFAINASGQVTGVLGPAGNVVIPNFPVTALNTPIVGHAFIYSNGTITDLGTLPGGKTAARYAINTNGQIVGASRRYGVFGTTCLFL